MNLNHEQQRFTIPLEMINTLKLKKYRVNFFIICKSAEL